MDSGKASSRRLAAASPIGVPAPGSPAGSAWSSLFEPKRFGISGCKQNASDAGGHKLPLEGEENN